MRIEDIVVQNASYVFQVKQIIISSDEDNHLHNPEYRLRCSALNNYDGMPKSNKLSSATSVVMWIQSHVTDPSACISDPVAAAVVRVVTVYRL
jgi:hypothetical protein